LIKCRLKWFSSPSIIIILLINIALTCSVKCQEVFLPENDPFESESISREPARPLETRPTTMAVYPLGIGDKLEVIFYEQQDLNDVGRRVEVEIQEDGTIFFPLLGIIVAAGRQIDELSEEIRKRILRYLDLAVVRVRLIERHSHSATLLGAFFKQGIFPLDSDIMLTDFIVIHSGLLPEADASQIWVIRENGNRILVNLDMYYKLGDTNQDIILISGDRVYAPVKKEPLIVNIVRVAQIAVLFLQVATLTVLLAR